ncbi:WG repeat-containing protein [Aureispira sp. CCB-QB1]|uniref:WG repeat-containing protein n=1 Tax=Aureispira sp. CCB-QB1 TaxID=1313421 RepID=UPI000695B00B|nr:WG repeat-containing protein [Aureispira sp. CCB-QB1]
MNNTPQQTQYYPAIIPFRQGEKWGYCTRDKDFIITPQYDQAAPFVGTIARVMLGDKYGLIDKTGSIVVPIVCDFIGNEYDHSLLNEDNSCTIIKDEKYGLVSTDGVIWAEMIYNSEEEAFHAAAERGWKGGIVEDDFPEIEATVLNQIHAVKKIQKGILRFRQNDKWGLMTEKGVLLLTPTYDEIEDLENDYWPFREGDKWGLLDLEGNIVLPAQYDAARGFSNGQAACQKDGLWGAVNLSGHWIFEPQFTELGEFKEGLSAAQKNGLYGFVDEYGAVQIDFQYPYVLDFSHGVCAVLEEKEIYFIDDAGTIVSERYRALFGPNEDLWMHVMKGDKWGIVQANHSFVLPIQYDLPKAMGQVLNEIKNGMIPIKKGALLGFANLEGKEVVPPQYVIVDPFCERRSLVATLDPKLNGDKTPSSIEETGSLSGVFNYGFINEEGREVIPRKYILAHRFKYGLAFVKNENFQVGYITYDGTEYFED